VDARAKILLRLFSKLSNGASPTHGFDGTVVTLSVIFFRSKSLSQFSRIGSRLETPWQPLWTRERASKENQESVIRNQRENINPLSPSKLTFLDGLLIRGNLPSKF
jgi:hypothetical protein